MNDFLNWVESDKSPEWVKNAVGLTGLGLLLAFMALLAFLVVVLFMTSFGLGVLYVATLIALVWWRIWIEYRRNRND